MSRREDADRTSSYNYADRRDGEKSRQSARTRSPLREKGTRDRDRDRDWDRNYDRELSPGASGRRYSADGRHNPRDGPYRGDRHQPNGGSSSPPRGPASYRQQDFPRGLQRSVTAPNPGALKLGSGASPLHPSSSDQLLRLFRNVVTPVADRALLKRRRQELEKAHARLRVDFEKSAPKHADFPSVRDMNKRATEKTIHDLELVNKDLEHNNNILNNETKLWLDRFLDLATQPHAGRVEADSRPHLSDAAISRLEALEQRMVDKENAWAEKEENWTRQQEAFTKQSERLSSLESDMTAAISQIQSLGEENAALKTELLAKVDSLPEPAHDAMGPQGLLKLQASLEVTQGELRDLTAKVDSLPEPAHDALGPEGLQRLQTSLDATQVELRDLSTKVDEAATTLADLDVEFVNDSCGDINVKLPGLENSINQLRAELQSIPPPLDATKIVTANQLEQSLGELKGRQNAIAVKLGNFVKDAREDIDARLRPLEEGARQPSLPTTEQAATARSNSAALENWASEEGRAQAIQQARQHETPSAVSAGTRDSVDIGDTANRLQALEDKALSLENEVLTIAKMEEHEAVCANMIQNLLERDNALHQRCALSETAQQQIETSVNDLRVKLEESEKQTGGRIEILQQSFDVLDSQYNNLSTEGLAQTIGGHIQNQRDDVISRLQQHSNQAAQLITAVERRVAGLEERSQGRGPNIEPLGNKGASDRLTALANGNH